MKRSENVEAVLGSMSPDRGTPADRRRAAAVKIARFFGSAAIFFVFVLAVLYFTVGLKHVCPVCADFVADWVGGARPSGLQ